MDELMQLVTEKVGLDAEQAEGALGAIMEFLKEKLPAPVASQLEGLLAGDLGEGVQGLAGGLGGALTSPDEDAS